MKPVPSLAGSLVLSRGRILLMTPPGWGGEAEGAGRTSVVDMGTIAEDPGPLTEALGALLPKAQPPGSLVHVVLLPPLVRYRMVRLPPLRPADLRTVLNRDQHRYFPARNRLSVGAFRIDDEGWTLLEGAPTELVEGVIRGVEGAGLRVGRVVGGVHAWWRWGFTAMPPSTRLHVRLADRCIRIDADERGPCWVREHPIDGASATDDGGGHGIADLDEEEALLAAAEGCRLPCPRIVPPLLAERSAQRRRRQALALYAVGAAVLALAGATELVGLHHRVERAEAERQRLSGTIGPASEAAHLLQQEADHLGALARVVVDRRDHVSALAELTLRLPPDAHLFQISAEGDSIMVRGAGRDAASVQEALAGVTGAAAARIQGAVRRELQAEGDPVEHFLVVVHFSPVGGT